MLRRLASAARSSLRRWRYSRRYGSDVRLGNRATIHPLAIIDARSAGGGPISIGSESVVEPYATVMSHGGWISIGDRSYLGPFTVLYGHGGLKIGNDVKIATSCVLVPSNHRFERLDVPIHAQGATNLGITIEDDVWLGARVTVLDGVTIATGCVVGAGAVVTKSTEAYGVYVGVPAKLIARRSGREGSGS